MSQKSFMASPISRKNIREIVKIIRDSVGFSDKLEFPIVEFLEIVLPRIDDKFQLEIKAIEEMGNQHGLTYPEKHLIILREDVYLNAIEGKGRDRLTIAHEIGHYFLHKSNSIALARTSPGERIKPYCDPEWQADAFAGELLVPYKLVRGMSATEVSRLCGVSYSAAKYQLSKI